MTKAEPFTERGRLEDVAEGCIARMMAGETLEDCLLAHPYRAPELMPLLQAARAVFYTRIPPPSPGAREAALDRMLHAASAYAGPVPTGGRTARSPSMERTGAASAQWLSQLAADADSSPVNPAPPPGSTRPRPPLRQYLPALAAMAIALYVFAAAGVIAWAAERSASRSFSETLGIPAPGSKRVDLSGTVFAVQDNSLIFVTDGLVRRARFTSLTKISGAARPSDLRLGDAVQLRGMARSGDDVIAAFRVQRAQQSEVPPGAASAGAPTQSAAVVTATPSPPANPSTVGEAHGGEEGD